MVPCLIFESGDCHTFPMKTRHISGDNSVSGFFIESVDGALSITKITMPLKMYRHVCLTVIP